MAVQPTRDQPMTNHDRMNYWWRRATQAEAELDSWMARTYEAEKRAWQAEAVIRRQERYIEGLESVDAVGLKARAQQAEARIRAVRDLCDDADKRHASVLVVTKVRRALEG